MRLIQFTKPRDIPIYINPDHVVALWPDETYTRFRMSDEGQDLYVTEDIDDVIAQLRWQEPDADDQHTRRSTP